MTAIRSLFTAFLCTLLLGAAHLAQAAGPPKDPILRIETGIHSAMIKGMAADAAGKWLVTASDDKTVRVWDLSVGGKEPVPARVLRPPIGEGNEGKLFAVAISPDGATVVCGGWTGWDWNKNASLYFFDRASGRLVKRLDGFPDVIKALAYSRDGRQLAVALGAGKGVYLLRVADWKLIGMDREYGNDCYDLEFDRRGRLVTVSWDGFLRLYEPGLKLTAKEKAPNGTRPYTVAFSPDGGRIAVGCDDGRKIGVVSGMDLTPLYTPPGGADDGRLYSVAWSVDGSKLYAAGSHREERNYLVRRWEDKGAGAFSDVAVAEGNVMQLLTLSTGGIAYAAAGPELGVINAGEAPPFRLQAAVGNLKKTRLMVSADASVVAFNYHHKDPAGVIFTVGDRSVRAGGSHPGLATPVDSAPAMSITGWQNGTTVKLNGKELPLQDHEVARSAALAPDASRLLLGSDWYLRCFDRQGNEQWRVAAPGIAWGANVSANGRIAVAAFGDGTIRWYRMSDGRELLAYFAHADGRRWVLWTPSGYYDASIGGEDLAGWNLNNGAEQASDFFPLSRFRGVYCRPDVINRVLAAGDEGEALRLANAAAGKTGEARSLLALLPPVVAISAPADKAVIDRNEAKITFSLRSPSGEPVTAIKVMLNGRPISFTDQEKGPLGERRTISVPVPHGESEIAVIAENRLAVSEPATVRVIRNGLEYPNEEISFQPRLFILSVGVGAYPNKELALDYAGKDARDFVSLMLTQKGRLYGEVTAKLYTDSAATRQTVLDGLKWLRQVATERDTAVVFLSGHGITESGGAYYYLPVDGDPDKPAATAVFFSEIKNTLMSLSGKAVLFVDTCHAANVMGGKSAASEVNTVVNDLSSAENGVVVFASSTGRQYSLEDESWGNGAFTKALVEGIDGKADYTGKGKVTVTSLDLWISERVQELTEGRQTPTTAKPRTIPDFALAVKK